MLTEQQKWDRMAKRLFAPTVKNNLGQGTVAFENRVKIDYVPNVVQLKELLGDKLIKADRAEGKGDKWYCEFKKHVGTMRFVDDSERLVLLKAYLELSIIRVD